MTDNFRDPHQPCAVLQPTSSPHFPHTACLPAERSRVCLAQDRTGQRSLATATELTSSPHWGYTVSRTAIHVPLPSTRLTGEDTISNAHFARPTRSGMPTTQPYDGKTVLRRTHHSSTITRQHAQTSPRSHLHAGFDEHPRYDAQNQGEPNPTQHTITQKFPLLPNMGRYTHLVQDVYCLLGHKPGCSYRCPLREDTSPPHG